MKNILKLSLALVTGLLALALTGCGGDSGGAATGPASGDSFAGTSITFNPTVNFTAGGNLTYFNNEANSPFPAADPAANGTYTYVPNASYTAGTLTLTVDGIQDPIVLDISNFTRTGPNVTGFTARSGGQSYPVTVTGTLVAFQSSGGGGTGSGETSATDIPEGMRGTYELIYFEASTGSGIANDSTETFTINARTLVFGSKTLTNPVFLNGNTLEWIFKDGNLWYAVSQNNLGGLNEINVAGSGGTPFYGQYSDESNTSGISLDEDGKYSAGTTFSAIVTAIVPFNSGGPSFTSVQTLTMGQTVTFTVSNNGDITGTGLDGIFAFGSATNNNVFYNQLRPGDTPAVSDFITITKDGDGNPESITVDSNRIGLSNDIQTNTSVSYTLTFVP